MSDSELHEKIVATNVLLENELAKWEKIGADPSNVVVDTFILDAFTHALVDFLVQEGIIEDEAFTFHFKKRLLVHLTNMREGVVEPAFAEARRQQIVNGLPNMNIPKKPRQH